MRLLVLLTGLVLGPGALAQSHSGVEVTSPWSRALPPVVSTGAAYLRITNHDDQPDRLVGASSSASGRVEIHGHRMDGGVAKMHRVEALDLPSGESVTFEPGGLHLMLLGLTKPLVEGDSFTLTLDFERVGAVVTTVPVLAVTATGGHQGEAMQHGMPTSAHRVDEHDHDGAEHEAHHGPPVDMAPGEAPSVTIDLTPDPVGGFNLRLTTERFRFAPERVNGAHVPGEGHAHLYVDGKMIARVYGPWFHIDSLTPGGHHIVVTLHTNGQAHYTVGNRAVMAQFDLVVPAP